MHLNSVTIQKAEAIDVILGQAHFIKAVEDRHETLVTAVPWISLGFAFCEPSGPCLIRRSCTDPELLAPV
jgi:adenosine/AMP kinase